MCHLRTNGNPPRTPCAGALTAQRPQRVVARLLLNVLVRDSQQDMSMKATALLAPVALPGAASARTMRGQTRGALDLGASTMEDLMKIL